MFKKQSGQTYTTTGTTTPIYIARDPKSKTVRPGENYFIVKIHSAQAAFSGPFWEGVRRLIIASQVALNHPILGSEPLRAIRRSREVNRGQAEQLGLSPNLINLVPATMDHVSISIEFIVDKENRLAVLGSLINEDTFMTAISLAPGVAMAARAVSGISQKILQAFLKAEERQPILQFSGDFNIATNELQEGYYVILGTRDKNYPLPRPLPQLEVQNHDLLADGKPVTQWSYVILDVHCLEVRTRALNEGAAWLGKIRQAESVAQRVANDPFLEDAERQQTWQECKTRLKEGQMLLLTDSNYLEHEAQKIIKAAYVSCYKQIFSEEASRTIMAPASRIIKQSYIESDRALLDIPPDENLEVTLNQYAEQVAESRRLIRQIGIQ